MADTGKNGGGLVAQQLNPAGYAVAGVSIRSSSQTKFPGQLHDIKAAIRWLRANATKYNFDPNHIAIMGDSSGGWTTAMAALTGDSPEMEGSVGTTGVIQRGTGRRGVLSADQLHHDGRLGAEQVRWTEVSRLRRFTRVPAGRLRHPNVPREGRGLPARCSILRRPIRRS